MDGLSVRKFSNLLEQVKGWALPNIKKQNEQWNLGIENDFFSDFEKTFTALYSKLPKQLIHRDPNPGNILFEKNKVSGFIDFELSECNVRLLDPCYCATAILSECQDLELGKGKWLVILKGVLEGYNEICNFTDEEKKAIFYVLCANQMTCTAYFENISEYKELARMNREMLIFIIESKDEILNIFL